MDEEGRRREAMAMLRRGSTIAELTVQLDGRIIGSYRHPIDEQVIRPLVGRGG